MVAAGVGWADGTMHEYSEEESLEVVKLLLEKGGDVKAANDYGITALHGAALQGCEQSRAALGGSWRRFSRPGQGRGLRIRRELNANDTAELGGGSAYWDIIRDFSRRHCGPVDPIDARARNSSGE
jgi:hypothetical protein